MRLDVLKGEVLHVASLVGGPQGVVARNRSSRHLRASRRGGASRPMKYPSRSSDALKETRLGDRKLHAASALRSGRPSPRNPSRPPRPAEASPAAEYKPRLWDEAEYPAGSKRRQAERRVCCPPPIETKSLRLLGCPAEKADALERTQGGCWPVPAVKQSSLERETLLLRTRVNG